MMSILQTYDNALFLDDSWYTVVSQSNNPIVQGFLAEQICLSHIAHNGLKAVHPNLAVRFKTEPAFTNFPSTDHKIHLYIPTAYNSMALDGVILLLDHTSKQASMFFIQFTLPQNDKQSDQEFYMRLWLMWTKPITSAGFNVQSTFVWIDKSSHWNISNLNWSKDSNLAI